MFWKLSHKSIWKNVFINLIIISIIYLKMYLFIHTYLSSFTLNDRNNIPRESEREREREKKIKIYARLMTITHLHVNIIIKSTRKFSYLTNYSHTLRSGNKRSNSRSTLIHSINYFRTYLWIDKLAQSMIYWSFGRFIKHLFCNAHNCHLKKKKKTEGQKQNKISRNCTVALNRTRMCYIIYNTWRIGNGNSRYPGMSAGAAPRVVPIAIVIVTINLPRPLEIARGDVATRAGTVSTALNYFWRKLTGARAG